MKQIERAGIFRLVTEVITSDAIIDVREMEMLDVAREKYSIRKEDEVRASSLPLSQAVEVLSRSPEALRSDVMELLGRVVLSDTYNSRSEVLLMTALRTCLLPESSAGCRIVSMKRSEIFGEPVQMLYVESRFDSEVNRVFLDQYQELYAEVRLAGFDLVYLPKIAEHYRSISDSQFGQLVSFLYPAASESRLEEVMGRLRNLSTSEFCNDVVFQEAGVDRRTINPSLMIKLGDSSVARKQVSNFLLFELGADVLGSVRALLDLITRAYQPVRLNYLQEGQGRFVFAGFHKQLFDLYMHRVGVKSRVVVDVLRDRIWFPDADVKIEKLHRREKALYALFLLESPGGGISFAKPSTPKEQRLYRKRMETLRKKYRLIYKKFGGEPRNAPDITIPEIRLPMIALLKRQLRGLSDVLYHVEDYMILRNALGSYCVNIPPSLCCCAGVEPDAIEQMCESEEWQKISSL